MYGHLQRRRHARERSEGLGEPWHRFCPQVCHHRRGSACLEGDNASARTRSHQRERLPCRSKPRSRPSHCHTRPVKVRVYDLAKELGRASRDILLLLRDLGIDVHSASAIVPADAAEHLRKHRHVTIRTAGPELHPDTGARKAPTPCRSAESRSDSTPAQLITTQDAARLCSVRPATIRQWVTRGHLQPCGRRGRTLVFARADVLDAAQRVNERRRRAPHALPVDMFVRGVTANALLTTTEAAAAVQVSPSTIRMWVLRGHLRVRERRGTSNCFRVSDVRDAARRR